MEEINNSTLPEEQLIPEEQEEIKEKSYCGSATVAVFKCRMQNAKCRMQHS